MHMSVQLEHYTYTSHVYTYIRMYGIIYCLTLIVHSLIVLQWILLLYQFLKELTPQSCQCHRYLENYLLIL